MQYSIGIDIGGTNTVIGLVDKNGNVIKKDALKTQDYSSVEDFILTLASRTEVIADTIGQEDEMAGVGIGAPNGNYYKGTIEYAPNLPFKGVVELKDSLENLFLRNGYNYSVTVTNDANAAAIGEMVFGGAKGLKNFMMITLGTGVGSGIVVDGKLLYGHTGFAGEVGHTIIERNGRQCNCGRKGCVERYASATGIVITAEEKLQSSDMPSLLRDIPKGQLTSKNIYEAAIRGDKLASECFDYTAQMLSIGLANACEITSPEKIFLFGGLAQSGDLLLEPLKKYFEQNLFSVFQNTISIELSSLKGEDAAVLGAAALAY